MKSRDINLEILRILCMLFIVMGHVGGRAGYDLPIVLMPHHVDCFILISGYFLINAQFKFERVLRTAIETIFYSFGITLVLYLLGRATNYELLKSIVRYFSDIVRLHYNSLITYCLAIFTFLWFKDWKLSNTSWFAKVVMFIAPHVFAVYLIHEQGLLRTKYMVEWFNMFVGFMPNWLYLFVFGFAVIILCALIDKLRVRLFKLVKLDLFIADLGKRIDKFYV